MIDATPTAGALLATSLVVSTLSQGRWSNSWTALLMPGLLVLTAASLGGWTGPVLVGTLFAVATALAWRGVLPGPPSVVAGTSISSGILLGIALAAGLFAADLFPWAGPVVLAITIAGAELAGSRGSPFGEWGLLAHTQARRPWAQAVGRRGPHAVSAVLVLVSGAAGFAIVHRSLALLVGVLAAVITLFSVGQVSRHTSQRLPVRAVGLHEENHQFFGGYVSHFVDAQEMTDQWWARFREDSLAQHRDLVRRTAEAGRDADLVVWSEGAGLVASEDLEIAMAAEGPRRTAPATSSPRGSSLIGTRGSWTT